MNSSVTDNVVPARFYITGGTLASEALSYVRREADDLLYQALLAGEFCYILTPRQMGKSSLMAQTARRLQADGVAVAVLDLSSVGSNLEAEQWVNGLLDQLGRRLKLEDELEDFVYAHAALSPLQRWQRALRDVVLPHTTRSVVVFLDEIDIVGSLPFSTDEFFAAIRACYNARADEADYRRLTFCLLGVATPAELIQNPRLTPFNIGTRIDLRDFTPQETAQLRVGLRPEQSGNAALVQRIYFWTGGHPCLTQRLFKTVAEDETILTESGVDACCRRLFLAPATETRDDNLQFVQQRLLPHTDEERAALLTLYRQVWEGRSVADNDTLATVTQLKLSGVARVQDGRLRVRNRIYRQVFDRAWIREHMPDAERRRQRRAFIQGVLRTSGVAAVLVGIFASLAFFAWKQTQELTKTQHQVRRDQYLADMNQILPNLEEGNMSELSNGIAHHYPARGEEDWRGFEWRYGWSLLHQDQQTLRGHSKLIYALAYSRDGSRIASGGFDGETILWDAKSGAELFRLPKQDNKVSALAFMPDGKSLIIGVAYDNKIPCQIMCWNLASRTLTWDFPLNGGIVTAIAVSRDGRLVGAHTHSNPMGQEECTLWNVPAQKPLKHWILPNGSGEGIAFSPDNRRMALPSQRGIVSIWDIQRVQKVADYKLLGEPDTVNCLAFSSDSQTLAMGTQSGRILCWNPRSGRRKEVHPSQDTIQSVVFSPDNQWVAAASWDQCIHVLHLTDGKTRTLRSHTNLVNAVAFSPDGRTLVSGGNDKVVRLWDFSRLVEPTWNEEIMRQAQPPYRFDGEPRGNLAVLQPPDPTPGAPRTEYRILAWSLLTGKQVCDVSDDGVEEHVLSPDARLAAFHTKGANHIVLKDTRTKRVVGRLSCPVKAYHLWFSPDNTLLAGMVSYEHIVHLWDIVSQTELPPLQILGELSGLRFSPDGRYLAIGYIKASQSEVMIWDRKVSRSVSVLPLPKNTLNAVAFDPSHMDIVALSDWEGPVEVWNWRTHQRLVSLRPHPHGTWGLAFSPDGRTLATGGNDGGVKLWNTATWRVCMTVPAKDHDAIPSKVHESVQVCYFTPDGTRFIAISAHELRVWNAATMTQIEERDRREGRPSATE